MIREQLAFRLEQQRSEVARLEADLASARQRFDVACIDAAKAPPGYVDQHPSEEDQNVRNYEFRLRGARLELQRMEQEQTAEGFAERVAEADRLLAAVEAENFVSELERTYGVQLSQLGAALAGIYQQTFAAIQNRQRRAAEAMAAAKAVGATIEDGPRLFGSLLDVHALIARTFWAGVRGALPARSSLNDSSAVCSATTHDTCSGGRRAVP
jgi:hypothetical protein